MLMLMKVILVCRELNEQCRGMYVVKMGRFLNFTRSSNNKLFENKYPDQISGCVSVDNMH